MPVFVTFVTAGYPRADATVDVMLALEAGGADVIELGVPFSDPIADGPAIQESNVVSRRSFSIETNLEWVLKLRPPLTRRLRPACDRHRPVCFARRPI